MKLLLVVVLVLCFIGPVWTVNAVSPRKIILPPGFKISVYADQIPGVREMAFSPSGILFAGSRGGRVFAIVKKGNADSSREVKVIAVGLNGPVGAAFYEKDLYVAEINRVIRFENIENRLNDPPFPVVVYQNLPSDTHHGWKFIRFGPDGKLYIPQGSPCNVCKPDNPIYGTLSRMNPDGSGFETIARGIRNSVGFDWNPVTHELWFTDNGRDYMGDNLPPDELNRISQEGLYFGFPYVHGKDILDPDFRKPADFTFTPPEMDLGPHVAALGMRFYTGSMFPAEYENRIFIAEHGSWNRSVPIGYRITTVTLDSTLKHAVSYDVFAEGWLSGRQVWGRPADVEVGPDGALYVSDDYAGVIYRISYGNSD